MKGRFLKNVFWNWTGTAVGLFSAFVLTKYMIRTMGVEGYGVWLLAFSLIEYYGFMDLGFRSAAVKYSAQYRAQGQTERINEIINTGLAFYSVVSICVAVATIVVTGFSDHLFNISPALRPQFRLLLLLVGLSWALGVVFVVFQACLEGFQRFDKASQITISSTVFRALGFVAVLSAGQGMVSLGMIAVASQMLGYALNFLAFRRIFPELQISRSLVKKSVLIEMARYGSHSFFAVIGGQVLNQGPVLIVGLLLPANFIGYLGIGIRLLQYTAGELIGRVSVVSTAKTSELDASGDNAAIAHLGVFINRYCVTIFLPFAAVLLIYGRQLLQVWLGTEYANNTTPLLLPLCIGNGIAIMGQFNSSSILYGMGKHKWYARGLLAEALVLPPLLYLGIVNGGLTGGVWVMSLLMIANRGLLTSWLLCHELKYPWAHYMASIYTRPVLVAIPSFAMLWMISRSWLPGRNLLELAAAGCLCTTFTLGPAFYVCLSAEHRRSAVEWAMCRIAKVRGLPVLDP